MKIDILFYRLYNTFGLNVRNRIIFSKGKFLQMCVHVEQMCMCANIFIIMQLKRTVKIWGNQLSHTVLEFSSAAKGHLKLVQFSVVWEIQLSSAFLTAVLYLHFPPDALRLNDNYYPNPEFDHGQRPAIGMGDKETKEIGREAGVNQEGLRCFNMIKSHVHL